jgi:hypothetical protein
MLRNLLCAGLLGRTLVAATAWSQSPMMYQYQSLSENGGYVFGYGETALWAPADWCQAWWGFCWDQYTSYVQLDLSLDSSSIGGNWAAQYNMFAATSVWCTVEAGQWQLNAYHQLEVTYRSNYWEWPQYALLSQSATLNHTVYPQISISGAQRIYDGDYGNFGVTVQRGNPLWYSWSYAAPPGAGNNPSVTFSNPEDELTETDGHWFASPDSACAPRYANYDVTGTTGFQTGPLSDTAGLTVSVPWIVGGETYPPTLIPHVSYAFVDGLWRVLPQTYFVRTNPFVYMYVPATSQFRSKVLLHEFHHQDQYQAGGISHLNEDLWNPTEARAAVINLTHATEAGLNNLIAGILNTYLATQEYVDQQVRWEEAEAEAYAISDPIAPAYLYQSGCN